MGLTPNLFYPTMGNYRASSAFEKIAGDKNDVRNGQYPKRRDRRERYDIQED